MASNRSIDFWVMVAAAVLSLLFVWAVAAKLSAAVPADPAAADQVDLVEVNHVYDYQGKSVLVQAVFYDWRPVHAEYQVRAWRLLKTEEQRPVRDWRRGGWLMVFYDGGILREVRAAAMRETWTQYDVERVERDRLPQEYRGGLLFERQPAR